MVTKQKYFFFLVFLCASVILTAQQSYPRPRSSEVVIVARVSMKPDLDYQFYKQYWPLISYVAERDRGVNIYKANIQGGIRDIELPAYDDGSVFLAGKVSIPRDRTLYLKHFTYLLAGNSRLMVILPVGAAFRIPEGTNYVYLGTFEYSWDYSQFDVDGIQLLDEFDDAQDFVTKTYGAGARLVRVPLINPRE